MGMLFLVLTILAETTAVICMKLSNGFQNRVYLFIAIVTYASSFVFLTLSLKSLPAGIANGIWAASSTVLVAIIGVFLFKEKLSVIQLLSIGIIAIGLVGLNWNRTTA